MNILRFFHLFEGFTITAIVVFSGVGCSNGGLSTLTGTVTIDGKPAPQGVSLQFSPTGEGASPSFASTDASGKYEAAFTANRKGIMPGEHLVKLIPSSIDLPMPKLGLNGRPIGPPPKSPLEDLPNEYYRQIETIQIGPGSNTYDFDLESE
ncbi:hypothetical protein [Bremerella sp. P1]|uniref:hypothetical protein n=1 Tax=Bremerella sp. P1 TaxID=3026424 RepID=UPI0023687439|nr:hypothetical protein [Bremerella sp. P1]WDI43763.1 hypothetical protein PSR63_07360 [Bremerella sp. P1]